MTKEILNGIVDGTKDISNYFDLNDPINIEGVENQEDLYHAFKLIAKSDAFNNDLTNVNASFCSLTLSLNNHRRSEAILFVLISSLTQHRGRLSFTFFAGSEVWVLVVSMTIS